jgi:hypothetical protein
MLDRIQLYREPKLWQFPYIQLEQPLSKKLYFYSPLKFTQFYGSEISSLLSSQTVCETSGISFDLAIIFRILLSVPLVEQYKKLDKFIYSLLTYSPTLKIYSINKDFDDLFSRILKERYLEHIYSTDFDFTAIKNYLPKQDSKIHFLHGIYVNSGDFPFVSRFPDRIKFDINYAREFTLTVNPRDAKCFLRNPDSMFHDFLKNKIFKTFIIKQRKLFNRQKHIITFNLNPEDFLVFFIRAVSDENTYFEFDKLENSVEFVPVLKHKYFIMFKENTEFPSEYIHRCIDYYNKVRSKNSSLNVFSNNSYCDSVISSKFWILPDYKINRFKTLYSASLKRGVVITEFNISKDFSFGTLDTYDVFKKLKVFSYLYCSSNSKDNSDINSFLDFMKLDSNMLVKGFFGIDDVKDYCRYIIGGENVEFAI